jgi:hypothetical protein
MMQLALKGNGDTIAKFQVLFLVKQLLLLHVTHLEVAAMWRCKQIWDIEYGIWTMHSSKHLMF